MARNIQQRAAHFQTWRTIKAEGESVGWRCTYADLARATEIPYETVVHICKRNGWLCADKDGISQINRRNMMVAHEDSFVLMQSNIDRPQYHV